MREVVRFDPPSAAQKLRQWCDDHAEVLATIPDEAIRIDIGRAVGGDFARLRVEDAYAGRFDESPEGA